MNASHGGHEPAIAAIEPSTDLQDYGSRSMAAQLSPDPQKQPSTSKDADESSSQSTGLLPPKRSTTRSQFAPSRAATWIWEILALIVGVLSFVAIIIVLRLYQNRFLSTWTLPITINAIISILTTLFKGALAVPVAEGIGQMKWVWFSESSRNLADIETYDRASRGPWGACILLAQQFVRRQRSYLVGLGAVVLLISLAVDPFSQATIQYYSCLRESTAELGIFRPDAWIPRTNTFITQGSHLGPQEATLDTRLTLAIYQGLLEPPVNSSVSVPVSCSSGNCTFPADDGATFTTLAMCHTCVDRSDAVESIPTDYAYNFTFDGITLTPSVAFNSSSGSNQVFRQGAWNWTNEVGFRGMSMIMVDGNFTMSPLAFDCALQPCVKTYAANTTKNIYTETEISRTLLHPLPKLTTTATIWELAVNRSLLSGEWKDCTFSTTNTSATPESVYASQIQQINASSSDVYQAVNVTPVEWYPAECVYRLDSFGYNSGLDDYLSSFFSNDEFANSLQYYTSPEAAYGSIWFTSLYAQGNITMKRVDNFTRGLADSLSAAMRVGRSDDMWHVDGTPWMTDTCVRVRWSFLSFLAVVLCLEIIFFGSVIVVNRAGDWKSSSLALLFHGLESGYDKDVGDIATSQGMYKTAETKTIKLEKVGGIEKLVEVS